jgi:hypothetical protein
MALAMAMPAAANLYRWTITPQLSIMAGPAPRPNIFGGPNLHEAWRLEMLGRVDAALGELREVNPGWFDDVLARHGVVFVEPAVD